MRTFWEGLWEGIISSVFKTTKGFAESPFSRWVPATSSRECIPGKVVTHKFALRYAEKTVRTAGGKIPGKDAIKVVIVPKSSQRVLLSRKWGLRLTLIRNQILYEVKFGEGGKVEEEFSSGVLIWQKGRGL